MTLDLSPIIHEKVLSSNSLINTKQEKSQRYSDIFLLYFKLLGFTYTHTQH